jgi:hypothetical protein
VFFDSVPPQITRFSFSLTLALSSLLIAILFRSFVFAWLNKRFGVQQLVFRTAEELLLTLDVQQPLR